MSFDRLDVKLLTVRDSTLTQAALAKKCSLCKAAPGDDCTNVITGQKPLRGGQIVHSYRLDVEGAEDDT